MAPALTAKPSQQIMLLQEDLERLSVIVAQLVNLPDDELVCLKIDEQLATVHQSLRRFELHCQSISQHSNEFSPASPQGDRATRTRDLDDKQWQSVRKEARRANRLARQLRQSLFQFRTGLDGLPERTPVPSDILRMGQTVDTVLEDLSADWADPLV